MAEKCGSLIYRIDGLVNMIKSKVELLKKSMNDAEKKCWEILINHFELLKKEPERTQKLYAYIFCLSSSRRLFRFISDWRQEFALGRSIAEHNFHVGIEFSRAGINFQDWLSYSGSEKEEVIEYDRVKSGELWLELEQLLSDFKNCFTGTELYKSICKDVVNIQKRKIEIQRGLVKITKSKDESIVFPTYIKSWEYLEKRGRTVLVDANFEILLLKIWRVLQVFSGKAVKKKYSVRLWRRVSGYDLLLGNNVNCCIAIGEPDLCPDPKLRVPGVHYKKYPAGILEYLIDKGIQVAVVTESGWGPIGACWLFLSRNGDGGVDLVADSFDLNQIRIILRSETRAIRSCMFRFLKKYADALGIQRVLLGKNGQLMPNGKRRAIAHDVRTDNLPVVSLKSPIEKLGGYFMNEPYFLESRLGNEAFEITF